MNLNFWTVFFWTFWLHGGYSCYWCKNQRNTMIDYSVWQWLINTLLTFCHSFTFSCQNDIDCDTLTNAAYVIPRHFPPDGTGKPTRTGSAALADGPALGAWPGPGTTVVGLWPGMFSRLNLGTTATLTLRLGRAWEEAETEAQYNTWWRKKEIEKKYYIYKYKKYINKYLKKQNNYSSCIN